MWRMLQENKPDDFVLATGQQHSVREFANLAFKELGMELEWHGEQKNEVGIEISTGEIRVAVDPRYYRPTEVESFTR